MDNKDFPGSPEPYESVMKRSSAKIDQEARAILSRGYGGMINLFSEREDGAEEKHLLGLVREKLAVGQDDVVGVDIEKVVNALELGIERYKLDIPEKDFEAQDIEENVFQYVFKYFGHDNKGWRMGNAAILDKLRDLLEKQKTDLAGSPFEDFLKTLDLDLGKDPERKKLIILYYPPFRQRPSY